MKKSWWITGCVLNLRGCVFGKEKSDDCTDVGRAAQTGKDQIAYL
jgi:hypothetical protein